MIPQFFYLHERLRSEDLTDQLALTSSGNRLQTPILIGCKFLMILTLYTAAFATLLCVVRCNQLSLKLYTGLLNAVK